MSEQPHLRPVRSDAEPGNSRRSPQRQRAGRPLPTDRIKMDVQPKVLHSIGRLSGPGKRPVTGRELSNAMGGLAPATVILSNRFLADAGWITNQRGEYRATDALLEYSQRVSAAAPGPVPDAALEALRGPAREAWFWQAIYPYFVNGKMPYADAVLHLMREAQAIGDHRPMIDNLIAWLVYIGLVTIQDDQIILAEHGDASATEEEAPAAGQRATPPAPELPRTAREEPTGTPGGNGPQYAISFDVRMTQDDLDRLDQARLQEFFQALGTVMTLSRKA